MKYNVTITETSQRTVEVEAYSRAEAEERAEELWGKEEYVLDSGDFKGADFQAEEAEEKIQVHKIRHSMEQER